MSLTADLVAEVAMRAGPVSAGAIPSGRRAATEEDCAALVDAILRSAPSDEVWIFAYGSLIWNPAFEVVESKRATIAGYQRSFCLGWDRWFRGTKENPGLMMVLDEGGSCEGMAFRLPANGKAANLTSLMRREVRLIPHSFPPRWVTVSTNDDGDLPAVTFVIDRSAPGYVGGLTYEQVADALAAAIGPVGSMAEYLHRTVAKLEELNIHDERLWELQELVALRIRARAPALRSKP
jgi:cation transport protein ChaC